MMRAEDSTELRWIREALEKRNNLLEEQNNLLKDIKHELYEIRGRL